MKTSSFTFVLAVMYSCAAYGQTSVSSTDAMKKFESWTGHWTGSGTTSMRGSKQSSSVDERIEWKVDGHALLINGLGKDESGKIVHEALGVLSYDAAEARYRLRTWTRDGRTADAWFNVIADNNFQWGFDTPQGKIRYTITLTSNTWKETGEFSADNTQWYPFFEMNLTKQAN